MDAWAVRRMIRRNIRASGQGDIDPLLTGYAEDAVLRWIQSGDARA